jgi:IS5 family transposase
MPVVIGVRFKDSGKIYSLHEPEVYCVSKGKEHKKYEFGAKASMVVGKNGGVILGAYSLPENDYDGHALEPTLEQVERVAGYRPAVAIEPRIGHLKSDFRLDRNFLKKAKSATPSTCYWPLPHRT